MMDLENRSGTELQKSDASRRPLVSVILLTYRNLKEIYDTLDSVFEQTYSNLELIINDDGTDGFESQIREVASYIERHRSENIRNILIHHLEKNVGTSRNINDAIRRSGGIYVRFISSGDEIYQSDVIEKCVDYCERYRADILIGQTLTKRREGNAIDEVKDTIRYRIQARSGRKCQIIPSTRDIEYLRSLNDTDCRELISSRPVISSPSVFYSMKLLKETGGFPEDYRLIEDVPYYPLLAERGTKFHFLPLLMTKYSLSGVSNTGGGNDEFWRDFPEIMKTTYIPNDHRYGLFNPLLRRLRCRELDLAAAKRKDHSVSLRIRYADAELYHLYSRMKYVLTGSRL